MFFSLPFQIKSVAYTFLDVGAVFLVSIYRFKELWRTHVNKNNLPITAYRDQILTTIKNNPVTIVNAQTGAGKSTQVPQFLWEEGYDVVCTQPRRLAARSLAERVAEEVGCELGNEVGYLVANDRLVSDVTHLRYITDGIQMVHELLGRSVATDNRVLIIDEAHEWNLNIEVLVAWAKQQIQEDAPFKVVLMSATLEAEKLSAYFNGAPVINVPGRLYPVEVKPAGKSIAEDVAHLVRLGRNVLVFESGKMAIEDLIEQLVKMTLHAEILPLHGELDPADQKKCFAHYDRPKIVISTNVAQTSVTIDDIDAVVDSGMERRIEMVNGVEGLYIGAISKADAEQRKGRAGRTKPGMYIDHCPERMYEDRRQYSKAEIERVRLDQAVLRLAEVGFDMETLEFFHQPELVAILNAKSSLKKLGCMDSKGRVTSIGRKIARMPCSVMYGRMILEADRLGVVNDVLTIAAIMDVGEIHMRKDREGNERREWRWHVDNERESDMLAQLALFKNADEMMQNPKLGRNALYEAAIRPKMFFRVKEQRRNLEKAIYRYVNDVKSTGSREDVMKCICAGMVDHLYRREYASYRGGADGTIRQMGKESIVTRGGDFVVALPFDLQITTRRGRMTLNLLRMVSKADVTWLEEVAPHLFESRTGTDPRWSVEHDCVVSVTERVFNNIVMARVEVKDPNHPEAAEIMVSRMYESFRHDSLKHLDINDPNATIPELVELTVGKHPLTGLQLHLYGTYKTYPFAAYEFWTRDYDKAVKARQDTLEFFSSKHVRSTDWFEPKPPKGSVASKPASRDSLSGLLAKFGK